MLSKRAGGPSMTPPQSYRRLHDEVPASSAAAFVPGAAGAPNVSLSQLTSRLQEVQEALIEDLKHTDPTMGKAWLTAHDQDHWVEWRYGSDSWQHQVVCVIRSRWLQLLIIMLLLLDVCIVFVELFLEAEFPSCALIERDAISCCPDPNAGTLHRRLSSDLLGEEAEHHSLCPAPYREEAYPVGCDPHKYDWMELIHSGLAFVSVSTLTIFEAELLLLIAAMQSGLANVFFRNLLGVLDLIIVTASLALELWIVAQANHLNSIKGLVIFARCWRFVRIGHGVATTVHEATHVSGGVLEARLQELRYLEANAPSFAPGFAPANAPTPAPAAAAARAVRAADQALELISPRLLTPSPAGRASGAAAGAAPSGDRPPRGGGVGNNGRGGQQQASIDDEPTATDDSLAA